MYLGVDTLVTRSVYLDASAHDDSASAATKLDLQQVIPKPCSIVYILGSCRGFILLRILCPSSYFYLWNPSTCAFKQLPASPSAAYPRFYGFGYDPSTDDYLLVQPYCISSAFDRVFQAQFEFLSLRANSWEKIEGPRMPYSSLEHDANLGLPLNGALHWVALHMYLGEEVIAAFDLAERSISDIPLPNDDECHHNLCHLWDHGGFLNLCVLDLGVKVSIWVMKEYKVQSSWSKWAALPVYDIPTKYFFPICYTYKKGYFYGKNGRGELVKCNNKGELLERRSYSSGSETVRFIHPHAATIMYTESLLPLPGDNGQAKVIDKNKN